MVCFELFSAERHHGAGMEASCSAILLSGVAVVHAVGVDVDVDVDVNIPNGALGPLTVKVVSLAIDLDDEAYQRMSERAIEYVKSKIDVNEIRNQYLKLFSE